MRIEGLGDWQSRSGSRRICKYSGMARAASIEVWGEGKHKGCPYGVGRGTRTPPPRTVKSRDREAGTAA